MYIITGYEHVKSKEGQVFTKVYIAQNISQTNGTKPFPIPYMVAGEVSFVPGSLCNIVLDQKQDGSLYVSGLNPLVEEGTVIS